MSDLDAPDLAACNPIIPVSACTQQADLPATQETIEHLAAALEQAERHHDICWDETERLSGMFARMLELKRELRARELAAAHPQAPSPVHDERAARTELASRIGLIERSATALGLQRAFYRLYTAELLVDKARTELVAYLQGLAEQDRKALGAHMPAASEPNSLLNAWALQAIERHMQAAPHHEEDDPVEQLNYRRWLVELSQGSAAYTLELDDEIARHEAELSALEQQAACMDFFDANEIAELEHSLVLQRGRIVACREQREELEPIAGALDKRLEASNREIDRFLA